MERVWLRGWYRRAEPSTSDSWSSPKLEVRQARRASSAAQRRVPMLRFMSRVATARTVRACGATEHGAAVADYNMVAQPQSRFTAQCAEPEHI